MENLIKELRNNLYISKSTVVEAMKYVVRTATTSNDPTSVLLASRVLSNSIANELERIKNNV